MPNTNQSQNSSFNYRITQFFTRNSRLTILAFLGLLVAGTAATLLLKTTGFPNPSLGIVIVQTVYPNASAETVLQTITQPLEGAIKGVDGVDTYSSTSNTNASIIQVTLRADANEEQARNKIETATKQIALPTGAQVPTITIPSIGGPDIIFAIANNDPAVLYNTLRKARAKLNQLSETASVEPITNLTQQVVITTSPALLTASGVEISDIQALLKTVSETVPVVSDTTSDGESKTIQASVAIKTLDELKALPLTSIQGKSYQLKDLATITTHYAFNSALEPKIGFQAGDGYQVLPAITVQVKAASGTNLTSYAKKAEDALKAVDGATFVGLRESPPASTSGPIIIETYSTNEQNQKQVHEVVSGLIGSKLHHGNPIAANAGWILGGVELVFLAMIAFVSWRAAVVSALAIPFSLFFSSLYIKFTGNDLNTLVLFSLVLAIGLVVDPALVILESVQRKVDAGLRGTEAALAAVKDVGNGLFMAAITSVIVFAPFALVSGVLGQIFSYIPMTIIPAVIGSYIVPLIFLSWLGGIFLRPSKKNTSHNEAENLWPIAKWLIRFNEGILHGSWIIRVIIILAASILPLAIAGYYIGSKKITITQFSSSGKGTFVQLTGTFLPTTPLATRQNVTDSILRTVADEPGLSTIFPFQGNGGNQYGPDLGKSFSYAVYLQPGASQTASDLAAKITSDLSPLKNNFFELKAAIESNGPPSSNYQVAISVQSDNLDNLASSAKSVGQTLSNICIDNNHYYIDTNCTSGKKIVEKVDDGFTNRSVSTLEILLDRNKLANHNMIVPNAPVSALVDSQLATVFNTTTHQASGTINLNGSTTDILLTSTSNAAPDTTQALSDYLLTNTHGEKVRLGDLTSVIQNHIGEDAIQRVKGQTIGVVQARLVPGYDDQASAARLTQAVIKYYTDDDNSKTRALGLEANAITSYSEGGSASFQKSFLELLGALLFSILLTYVVLVIFFESFSLPLIILFTIPLSFIGIFPALVHLGPGQFGFFEIIGLIILVGIVENVAIFLIDAARQKINDDGWDEKKAIAYASGIRFRPVILTKVTAIASLAPLAITSDQYRSISLVIIFGLLTSGISSLFTTPILYVFFRWLSRTYRSMNYVNKVLFLIPILTPIYVLILAITRHDRATTLA